MIALHLLELNGSSWIYSIIGTALKKVRDSISMMDNRTETSPPPSNGQNRARSPLLHPTFTRQVPAITQAPALKSLLPQ